MKPIFRRITSVMAILTVLLVSCDKQESSEAPPEQNESHAIDGAWHLRFITCLCIPVELNEGAHLWNIDVEAGTLEVIDNTIEDIHTAPTSGTYNLTVTSDSLFYNQGAGEYGFKYYLEDGQLHLAQAPEMDGPLIRLSPGLD